MTDISVLCVDDNDFVAEAIERKLKLERGFRWVGWRPSAVGLVGEVRELKPDVVLLDIDMPGADSFEVLAELASTCAGTRVIVLSGHVRRDYIDRAISNGAWGYVSKNEETRAILDAIRRVAAGEFVMGPEVESELNSR